MRYRSGWFCLLLFLLGLLVGVEYAYDRINTHYWQSSRLQVELQHTLQRAQQSLRIATNKLAQDRSFIKSIIWKLAHSAQQSISAATANEEYWQVTVWNKKCAVLHGENNIAGDKLCRSLQRGQEQLFTSHKPPQFGYLQAFTTTDGAVAVTIPLHEKWLAQQQQLAALRAQLPPTRLVINTAAGAATPSLFYVQGYLNHLFQHADRYQKLLHWTRVGLYVLLALLCVILYLLVRKDTRTIRRDLQHLATWSEQPREGGLLQVKVEDTLVQSIFNNFGKVLQTQLHYLGSVKKQIAVKNKLLASMSKENHRVCNMLAQQVLARTVIDQAAHYNVNFIANNIAIRDNAQDLRAAIFAIHRQQLKPLLRLSNKWRQEFSQRHVADFLGAYYNTEQGNFLLQLERDIKQLATLAEETYASLTNTLSFSRQLSSRSRNLLMPLHYWERMLDRQTPQLDVSFAASLRQAQELTLRISLPHQIKFSNCFDNDYNLLAAPAMLIAAFYHLYQFFIPETYTSTVIANHTVIKNKQLFVTISTTCNKEVKHNTVKKFHLTQARSILQKYQIEVLLSWLNNSLVISTTPPLEKSTTQSLGDSSL